VGYNVVDIINKAIDIENRRRYIINNLIKENQVSPVISLISKVLCNQIDEIIKYYEDLKEEMKYIEIDEIDVRSYDKMSFLINEFNERMYVLKVANVREFLKSTLEITKNKYSLFIDIQGRLVNNTSNTGSKTYEILSKIIANTLNQIRTIERTIV